MATLTGSTIASTYKQLLKVTSEGIGADASAKYIEDGLGTDSALSISTTRVGIGTAAPTGQFSIYKTGGAPEMIWEVAGNSDARNWGFRASGSAWGDFQLRKGSSLGGALDTSIIVLDANSRISISNRDAGTSNTVLGYQAGNLIASGDNYNVFIGHQVAVADMTNATQNIGMGYQSLNGLTTGDSNVCIGSSSGYSLTTANKTIFIGHSAGGLVTVTGGSNVSDGTVGIGHQALAALTSGSNNLAVGYQALDACNTGVSNIAIGSGALGATTDGVANVGMGLGVLGTNVSGNYNTAFGHQALQTFNADVDGQNTAMGINAGQAITTGDNNTLVGAFTGDALQGGADNTIIGSTSDASAVGGVNQTVIGYATTGVADNSVTLGNDNVTDVYMASNKTANVFAATYITQARTAAAGIGATPADENSAEMGPGYINLSRDDATDVKQILFGKNGSEVGSISTTTSTAFNTSSDYRLKENETAISDGLSRLSALKPYRFNWKAENDEEGNPTRRTDGMFAHEVSEVVPEAVNGLKDAINEDGGIAVQSMDYSKLIPILVAAVQELTAKVEALENA